MKTLTDEKLTIVGAAGMIGSNMAQTAIMMGLTSNICLYDPYAPGLEGVAEELFHCGFEGVNITFTSDIKEALTGAKYIVNSGGAARKAGMTREDLLKGNAAIAEEFGKNVKAYCPDVKHIVVIFNPADITGLITLLYSGLKPSQVTTLAALDSTRLRSELAKHFGISMDQVENCRTYGGHGEQMAVFASTAKVDGKPLTELIGTDALTKDQWAEIQTKVTKGGANIIASTAKVAVVTGAARGIGKAIALKFAQEGANIAFTDLVIDENGLATQAEIEALGVKAKGYASNAANFEETHNVVAEIVKDFGRIDILVNNAGITKDGLMMRMSEGQWDAVLNVNLKSAFNFIHACTPVMMKQRAGSIINMSSVVGVHGNAGQANYSASKAGMIGLAKSVAQELGSRGIRANAIAPGFIITDMTAQLSDEVRAEWCKKIPLRRGGTVEDVANIATFLASDMSSYVSGQVIQVDGGMNM